MYNNNRILFLTTGNLSMKPRLVKEIQLAKDMGFLVDLIAFKINNWTDDNHDIIIKHLGINSQTIYATKKSFIIWFVASILNFIILKVWKYNKTNLSLSSFASNKRSIMLWLALLFKSRKSKYKIIIGRNTASIFPVLYAAKKYKAPIGFDVEDFHPGEKVSWCNPKHEEERRKLLMNKIFRKCSYISVAGSPIMNMLKKEFTIPTNIPFVNLNNSFSFKEFIIPNEKPNNSDRIQLIWFSVDISATRGLEELITALKPQHQNFHLTLYGTRIESFYKQWIEPNLNFITVKKPVIQSTLHNELANHDIGLALEMSKTDINKQLAISNKLFAYIQSGLYTLATDTLGHKSILDQNTDLGIICGQTPEAIAASLQNIKTNISKIRNRKQERFEKGKELAWEKEREKLVEVWKEVLSV